MLASSPTSFCLTDIILYLLAIQNYHTEFLTGTIFNWEHLTNINVHKPGFMKQLELTLLANAF